MENIMSIRISASSMESYVGDVRPIWLEGEGIGKNSPIKWRVEGDAVKLRTFRGSDHGSFSYGVLVTFLKVGEATVTATLEEKEYSCRLTARAMRDFSGEKMNFYRGELHDHTTSEHNHDNFLSTDYSPAVFLDYIDEQNLRDFAVESDHASVITDEYFFRCFSEHEKMRDRIRPIVFPSCESEIMYVDEDRYGIPYRYSGELLTINADNYAYTSTFEEFFYKMRNNPQAIGIYAHPHVIGGSTRGIWNYRPRQYHPAPLVSLMKGVEVLGCPQARENLLHEYVYSEALDAGMRISTTCGSDQHHTWDFTLFPCATVIMAPEKSHEAFLDAMHNLRFYACESGNIKLSYTVNGHAAPCELPLADKYHFEVRIGYFEDDNSTRPVRCEVISDLGKVVKVIEGVDFESFSFDIESDTARWFYLRFVDAKTMRTFSPPVFTGREPVPFDTGDLIPIDKSGFKAYDGKGRDASLLVDDDPLNEWVADGTSAEIIIDMGREETVRALGNYAVAVLRPYSGDIRDIMARLEAIFPVSYRISTSLDGVNYELCDEGLFRTFSGEEIVKFAPRAAKFVKVELLDTTGSRLGRAPYSEIPMKLAELTLFK